MADTNDNEGTHESVQASAGAPQRPTPADVLFEAVGAPEPTAAQLDARQADIGARRRAGPPLPEGVDAGAVLLEAVRVEEEPTEVVEPRRQDR